MNRGLLLYTMITFAAGLVVYALRVWGPPTWRLRLHRLMLGLLTLALTVFGATYVAAGTDWAIGWLLIATATFGSVIVSLRANAATQ